MGKIWGGVSRITLVVLVFEDCPLCGISRHLPKMARTVIVGRRAAREDFESSRLAPTEQCFGRLAAPEAASFVTHRHASAAGRLRYNFHPSRVSALQSREIAKKARHSDSSASVACVRAMT